MNKMTKIGMYLLAVGSLTLSCAGPLLFQDPSSARQAPAYQNQRRFGARPMMGQDPAFGMQIVGMSPQQMAAQQQMTAQQFAAQQAYGTPQGMAQPYGAQVQQPQSAFNTPLTGWSGQVAAESGEGQTRMATGEPKHGLEPQVESRMHILNLYQEVLDERDSLLIELERLNSALSDGEQLLTQLRASEKEFSLQLAAMEQSKLALTEQNRDLSARLTIAQIRRLESDKLLLETQIAMHSATTGPAALGANPGMLLTEK